MKSFVKWTMLAFGAVLVAFIGWRLALRIHPVRVVADFEGCPATRITKITNTRWRIYTEDKTWKRPHFFLFRVEGADGRTITFDIPNAPPKWRALNPVYSYATSLDDLRAFTSAPVTKAEFRKAPNGPKLPDTSGQSWHFIENVKLTKGTFRFTQSFDKDAYVGLTYPYTPGYHQRYHETLAGKPGVEVITVGSSRKGRPLQVVKIGEGGPEAEKWKPCVLIYAREHGDEQSSSWAAQGAIEFLISDAPEAREIRKRFTFLVIALLDADGAAAGVFEGIAHSFSAYRSSEESRAYAGFFKAWVDNGKPLQWMMNLRSLETIEGRHLSPIMAESEPQRRRTVGMFWSGQVQPLAAARGISSGFTAEQTDDVDGSQGRYPMRKIGGEGMRNWLRESYGAVGIPVVLNAQEGRRHLTIEELRGLGALLVEAAGRYLSTGEAAPLLASVEAVRRDRDARWQRYASRLGGQNAFDAEQKARWLAEADSPKWESWRKSRLASLRSEVF